MRITYIGFVPGNAFFDRFDHWFHGYTTFIVGPFAIDWTWQ